MSNNKSMMYTPEFKSISIPSCKFNKRNFKELFKLLAIKAQEAYEYEGRYIENSDAISSNEKQNLKNFFAPRVNLAGYAVTTERKVFNIATAEDIDKVPDNIDLIRFQNKVYNNTAELQNNFEIIFDFQKQRIIDFTSPIYPTNPNKSFLNVAGTNNTWVNGLYAEVNDFLKNRHSSRDWLHNTNTYNFLLIFLFFPVFLFFSKKITGKFYTPINDSINLITIGIYIYALFLSLFIFRILFNYAKWIFPLIELDENKTIMSHRFFLSAIVLPLIVAALWDLIKIGFNWLN